MRIAIVGTGYVGLTTGVALAYLGHDVTCVDVDQAKIALLRHGSIPFHEPNLPELFKVVHARLAFTADSTEAGLASADVIFIAVGTPPMADGGPNLSHVQAAARAIGEHLGEGFTVVVNKSTVPIGSGNWVGAIIREAFQARNGHQPRGQFAVASNPEFLREGSALHDSFYPDRIVIGAEDQQALSVLTELYRPILNQDFAAPEFLPRPDGMVAVPMVTADLASAELVKYAANAFLALKISYINEVARLAERVGADIRQVARGMGLDSRIGSRFLNAGVGWGGSCFGKDTSALLSTAAEYGLSMPIVQSARSINDGQRGWVVDRLLMELRILKGRTICLLGLAFKPNTDDLRDSPAVEIARLLQERGARVQAYDPVAMDRARREITEAQPQLCASAMEAATEADAVVLVTEWPEFRQLDWQQLRRVVRIPLVIDGRNFLPDDELTAHGFRYVGVGRGGDFAGQAPQFPPQAESDVAAVAQAGGAGS
ncbi:MAG TPA: UDP-glucose/GDP-mannose dehydrogenase family protein [Anaerolineales bacterium]|jgi:UDPglucose 6-dehydrogenase